MAKSPQDITAGNRKKQLNVVYFIDSSRTRSFRMPLARVNLLLILFAGLIIWSASSIALLMWLGGEKQIADERLRSALATVFDYETRYDNVYEVAYPLDTKGHPTVAATTRKAPPLPEVKPTSPMASAKSNAVSEPPAEVSTFDEPEESGDEVAATEPNKAHPDPTPEVPAAGKESSASDAATPVVTATDAKPGDVLSVTIENPVLETTATSLDLRFDIKSKVNTARADGYVWAIAEFKTDQGKIIYLGEPRGIEVKPDGEPQFPKRSNKFAVRFFKRKRFSFPLMKNTVGTFIGVRIGVMANTSDERMIYKVPVNIRIGEGASKENAEKVNPG